MRSQTQEFQGDDYYRKDLMGMSFEQDRQRPCSFWLSAVKRCKIDDD